MILFPNAKINLGLYITEKRTDGYHNIETCFYPIGLSDVLEFIECTGETSIAYSGIPIPGNPQNNLCIKAWQLLHTKYDIPSVSIHLYKNIPIGAGLGGGSSDAAYMLKGLNDFFKLGIPVKQLEIYASELGSDCAFFISNVPSIARGRGEILSSLNLDLSGYKMFVVNPNIHISTLEAYSMIKPKKTEVSLEKRIHLPVKDWMKNISNDFEAGIFQKHPEILRIKELLLSYGAVYASMSGSGSSVFGIFENAIPSNLQMEFKDIFCRVE